MRKKIRGTYLSAHAVISNLEPLNLPVIESNVECVLQLRPEQTTGLDWVPLHPKEGVFPRRIILPILFVHILNKLDSVASDCPHSSVDCFGLFCFFVPRHCELTLLNFYIHLH